MSGALGRTQPLAAVALAPQLRHLSPKLVGLQQSLGGSLALPPRRQEAMLSPGKDVLGFGLLAVSCCRECHRLATRGKRSLFGPTIL